MNIFENKGLDKPVQTFMENTTLSILNYILEEGVEGALNHFSGMLEDEVKHFPYVAKALRDRGLLK